MQINLGTVFFIATLLIALHLLSRNGYVDICCCPESVHQTTVIIDTIVRTNEIIIPGEYLPKPEITRAQVPIYVNPKDSIKTVVDTIIKIYRDTIIQEDVKLIYSHNVLGELLRSDYSIRSITERPIIISSTTTQMPQRSGLDLTFPDLMRGRVYGMMGYHGITRDIGMGGAYVGRDYIFTYMYGLGEQTHAVGVGLRLF